MSIFMKSYIIAIAGIGFVLMFALIATGILIVRPALAQVDASSTPTETTQATDSSSDSTSSTDTVVTSSEG
jgi:hypothetical protein